MSNELRNLISASYDIVYVVSHEEDRVVADVLSTGKTNKMNVAMWSFSSGLTILEGTLSNPPAPGQTQKGKTTNLENGAFEGQPGHILGYIRRCSEDTIFILLDFHSYLRDAEIVRELRDGISKMKSNATPVVIVSPVLKLPVELEKVAAVIDYDLPTAEDIGVVIDGIVESLKSAVPTYSLDVAVRSAAIKACQGLTMKEVENVLMKSMVEKGTIDPSSMVDQKKQIVKKSGILEYCTVKDTMEDVGGLAALKDWLHKRGKAFSDDARRFGLPTPKGLLLLGIPGCGKSMVCKAIAKSWNMPLLRFDVGAVMQGIVGSSEENMRKVIQTAEASAPCVLWMDEIEKGLSGTGSSNFSDAGTLSRVFGTFITWLNDKESAVFVVATANNIEQLPPELLRKGRFDEIFFVDLPSFEERKKIFSIHLAKKSRDPKKFNLDELAKQSDGFSGSDIKTCIESAMFDVYTDDLGKVDIGDINIIKSIKETVPLSKLMSSQITKTRQWCVANRARLASERTEVK